MRIAAKPFTLPPDLIKQIKFISPNIYELNAIAVHLKFPKLLENTESDIDRLFEQRPSLLNEIKEATFELSQYIDHQLITLGGNGVLIASKNQTSNCTFFTNQLAYVDPSATNKVCHRVYDVEKLSNENVVNVSGAGDSFNVGFISAMLKGNASESNCVFVGFKSARVALQSTGAVPPTYFGKDHACWSQEASYRSI